MKKGLTVVCALLVMLSATQVFAAKNGAGDSKVLWVSPEKNGTEIITQDGETFIQFEKKINFSGYKYLTIETYSPDANKIAIVSFDAQYGEEEDGYLRRKSATVHIRRISNKPASYQGSVYGEGMQYYDHWKELGNFKNLVIAEPDEIAMDRLAVGAFDSNWARVVGAKIYVKKITATNAPLGELYEIDLSEKGFIVLEKQVWDDGTVAYGASIDIGDMFTKMPKVGDVVRIKFKGKATTKIEKLTIALINDWSVGYQELCQSTHWPEFSPGERRAFEADFIIAVDNAKSVQFYMTGINSKKPVAIVFE